MRLWMLTTCIAFAGAAVLVVFCMIGEIVGYL